MALVKRGLNACLLCFERTCNVKTVAVLWLPFLAQILIGLPGSAHGFDYSYEQSFSYRVYSDRNKVVEIATDASAGKSSRLECSVTGTAAKLHTIDDVSFRNGRKSILAFTVFCGPDSKEVDFSGHVSINDGKYRFPQNSLEIFVPRDEANACARLIGMAQELGLSILTGDLCRQQAGTPPPGSVAQAVQATPQPVRPTCGDGSPIPANGICPTLTFPSPAERAKQEEQQRRLRIKQERQEAAKKAADDEVQLRRAQDEAEERRRLQQLQDDMAKLIQGAAMQSAAPNSSVSREIDDAVEETTTKPTLGRLVRDALGSARESYHNLLVRTGDCIRLIACPWWRDRSPPPDTTAMTPQRLFADIQVGSFLNAIPPLGFGYYIWGSRNVEEAGRMIDTAMDGQ